jgi:methylated-DNA-protein-cysteine methyltransferase-like protein
VISAQGRISTSGNLQRAMLEEEGVIFDERGYTDLQRYLWEGAR